MSQPRFPHPLTIKALRDGQAATECSADIHLVWLGGIEPRVQIIHTPSGLEIGTLIYRQGWREYRFDRPYWWGVQRFDQALLLARQLYPNGAATEETR